MPLTEPSPFTYHPTNRHLHLHYPSPAPKWSHALPVGNGRLGAMVYGRTDKELLQLNEDSVWYGGPQDRTPRDAAAHLPQLRQLIREGRHAEAEELVRLAFFSTPHSMRHYEPLGKCEIEFAGMQGRKVEGYRRWLDLEKAMTSVVYAYGKEDGQKETVRVRRDVIASYPDQTLVMRVRASERISFVVRLNRTSELEWETNEFVDSIESRDNRIIMHATPGGKNSNPLCTVLGVSLDDEQEGGQVEAIGNCLRVTSAACTIILAAQTAYRHPDPFQATSSDVAAALQQPWETLLSRHIANYQSLFNRVTLRLHPDANHLPTDQRLTTTPDPGLIALYYSYGRYLLISSSRPGHKPIPATLQGIWNPSFTPAWGSKYTININLQMNYWPVTTGSLPECFLPVVELLERMAVRGKVTAETMYNCRGWCAHHNTDIWADTDPQDRWMPSTLWPLGGVWMMIDAMEVLKVHYDGDVHARLVLLLRGAVEFLLDYLVESKDGQYLITNPSLSPENTYIDASGAQGILCEGSVMDITLVRWAFELYLWSNRRLSNHPSPLHDKVKSTLSRLPPLIISPKTGLIQEWGLNDYDELEPGHRHVSHLLGLYPGRYISSTTPELKQAAARVLRRRAEHGGGHTGWSRAWLINLHARLEEAEEVQRHIQLLLNNSTMPNMLDDHPPFQIDGNFGGCAGIAEALVQAGWEDESERSLKITLLPAAPGGWKKGEVKGITVLGGHVVDMSWEEGQVGDAVIVRKDGSDARLVVAYAGGKPVELKPGKEIILSDGDSGSNICKGFRVSVRG
ncbi:hypothetical protein DL546_004339 [Coniochaeta pulveracea]|uniref:Uncharacterized protein n=1 Tax=Coniochaeta pulveracea TaxID=177199 RepID=A0A420YIR6_9PEZI|nr:hypothetical protein DL546_004339 [Coniochaeta pulveracea]